MDAVEAAGRSPGALLREARLVKGLDLDQLALSMKVSPRKIEALEADRFDQLPDPAFARALAMAVCRALDLDAAPVLAGLPKASQGAGLEHVTRGLDQPFEQARLSFGPLVTGGWTALLRPAFLAPLALIIAAGLLFFFWPMPPDSLSDPGRARIDRPAAASESQGLAEVASGASSSASLPPGAPAEPSRMAAPSASGAAEVSAPVALDASPGQDNGVAGLSLKAAGALAGSQPAVPVAAAAAQVASPSASTEVQLLAREASWVEVRDARGRNLLARLLQPGERVSLDGVRPLRLKIGNASGTDLIDAGQPVDLGARARDNVARIDLP